MEENEEVRGGIVSPNLVRGYPRGYALYTTNKHIIGVKKAKTGVGGLIFQVNPVGGLFTESVPKDRNSEWIQKLEKDKDFELIWDNIGQVEFKKPGTLIGGQVVFIPVSGEQISVKIGTKKDFEIIVSLLRRFLPEAKFSGLNP